MSLSPVAFLSEESKSASLVRLTTLGSNCPVEGCWCRDGVSCEVGVAAGSLVRVGNVVNDAALKSIDCCRLANGSLIGEGGSLFSC